MQAFLAVRLRSIDLLHKKLCQTNYISKFVWKEMEDNTSQTYVDSM